MMLRAPSVAVKSHKQKCSGSGTDVREWRKASCCFNRHLMDLDYDAAQTHTHMHTALINPELVYLPWIDATDHVLSEET